MKHCFGAFAALAALAIGPAILVQPGVSASAQSTGQPAQGAGNHPAGYFGKVEWSWVQRLYGGNTQYFTAKADLKLTVNSNGAVTGQLEGTQTQKLDLPAMTPACTSDTVTPGTLQASVAGQFTPDRQSLSLTITPTQFTPPQVTPCPAGPPGVADNIQTDPDFATVLQALQITQNGDFIVTREFNRPMRNPSYSETLHITLRVSPDCRDPQLISGTFIRPPFPPGTAASLAPRCESCPGGMWQLKHASVRWYPSQREDRAPQCVYGYDAVWLCTANTEVSVASASKVEDGSCIPRM
jgi:hypothetical protein